MHFTIYALTAKEVDEVIKELVELGKETIVERIVGDKNYRGKVEGLSSEQVRPVY